MKQFRVRVTDARNNIAEREFTIRITEILEIITPMTLPGGTRGKDYQASIYAKGGTSPYMFSLKTGQLPESFTFTPNGLLSGYASDIGTYNFVIQVTDSDGATVDKLFL